MIGIILESKKRWFQKTKYFVAVPRNILVDLVKYPECVEGKSLLVSSTNEEFTDFDNNRIYEIKNPESWSLESTVFINKIIVIIDFLDLPYRHYMYFDSRRKDVSIFIPRSMKKEDFISSNLLFINYLSEERDKITGLDKSNYLEKHLTSDIENLNEDVLNFLNKLDDETEVLKRYDRNTKTWVKIN